MNSIGKVTDEVLANLHREMKERKTTELFLLFALGSQYDHLIYQAMAAQGVFCVYADPGEMTADDVLRLQPRGIVLSGGPSSVSIDPPPFDRSIFDLGIPVLGICLGLQLWAEYFGASVIPGDRGEYGSHRLTVTDVDADLLYGIPSTSEVIQSHRDVVVVDGLRSGWRVSASTDNCPAAVVEYKHCYGVQFHPEVSHPEHGNQIFTNFCFSICGAVDVFPAGNEAQSKIRELKAQIGPDQKVLLCLSGGCDSSVVAELLRQACPDQTWALYIKGVDRPDDEAVVREYWGKHYGERLIVVDATDRFLAALAGITSMREKRIAIRAVYKEVVEKVISQIGADFIAQGTLYTDITESGHGVGSAATKAQIKLHHNVELGLSVTEILPLADCHKDGARQIGRKLGMPEEMLVRHPFPGPGLVVRIAGEITADALRMAWAADGIYIEELRRHNLYETMWQAGASLLDTKHTYTMGDDAGEGLILMLWGVSSTNGYTARAVFPSVEFLSLVSTRITNEVPGIACVAWRTSDKPPATIEIG